MKSLIFTNPTTKETTWCVADIECELTVEQYIRVVHIGSVEEEHYTAANFAFVDQPAGVSMNTHIYTDGKFSERPPVVKPLSTSN
jgi:hypothetical protein